MAFRPYLAFAGNCREAFTQYKEIFGGELVLLTMAEAPSDAPPPPGAKPGAIMHAAPTPDDRLLGARRRCAWPRPRPGRGHSPNCRGAAHRRHASGPRRPP